MTLSRIAFFSAVLVATATPAHAQLADPSAAMHWRQIGPPRAGRARAVAGIANQPNVAYIGFDNGGVWKTTDYGSNWEPIFDSQPTGSIGAIGVAASDPNIIYVGSGAGIIRPDLATGDGMYKSTDAGKTWTHLGLRQSQMIAQVEVDPKNPNRLFVAALGHPYGPNEERGVFRSTDGGATFQKVLYKDEYTSANDVRIDPSDPNIVYAALWEQQQSFIEGGGFGGAARGIFKSTDGGSTWKQLEGGLPPVMEANLAISPSNPKVLYAVIVQPAAPGGGRGGGNNPNAGAAMWKSVDGGEHWFPASNGSASGATHNQDPRPMARIGGGDLPTIVVDGKNENVVYSCSTVFWRTEDGGVTWSAVRGAPGGDDYQRAWVNPINPDIIVLVADQGGVVSGNRGKSWSNWYNQPTAAMYHVTTDMAFPYRVCSGQQDSGSACVDSRSMDGEITFHDWHPVNIQEYGVAAPDPKNPDLVYGSQRQGVSLYDRRTSQTTGVGPSPEMRAAGDKTVTDPSGANRVINAFGRNVRTMPIQWSPVDNKTLFYAASAVFKSTDQAHSWTRISPDLARQTWEVPATASRYAANAPSGPQGSITALSASPRDIGVIWTGTDDGAIQVTMDGGAKWTNVTPPSMKAWTRIFNIEAGHYDSQTAYAAANTMRIDDMNPHFLRTHDGGKTWTEITTGLAPGAVANSIREDPRKKGLLYAATETQVWYSFDDGDHWNSLKIDMPAISVRDIQVKDDSTCMCADLVAGTHGRGFWILDDLTPLRAAADIKAAESSRSAYLVKPMTAVRVRFATNDPTPWPPEMPAGENPPMGAPIDYYLASASSSPVKLEIVDAKGKTVRTYSSDARVPDVDPAKDPVRYNQMCQQNPGLPDCALPLYWPAPVTALSAQAGMHRFSWDMRLDPITEGGGGRGGGGGSNGAVPHRTYTSVNAPWAPPGSYTVKLTVDGKSMTQPIAVRLDPRVKTPAVGLAQMATLTREMYDGAVAAHAASAQARALAAQVEKAGGADAAAFKAQLDSIAPPQAAGGGGGGRGGRGGRGGGGAVVDAGGRGGRGGGATAPSLDAVSTEMLTAAMAMQNADVAPTATQVANVAKARTDGASVMAKWTKLKTTGLTALNAKLKAGGQPTIEVPKS